LDALERALELADARRSVVVSSPQAAELGVQPGRLGTLDEDADGHRLEGGLANPILAGGGLGQRGERRYGDSGRRH
jgi:hypothetical protein